MTSENFAFARVVALIEETFDRPPGSVRRGTRCDEVPGWDSLGHSVLLSRLSNRLGLILMEEDAMMPSTVGEFHRRITAAAQVA